MTFLLALLLAQQTVTKPGTAAPYVINVQGNAAGTPVPVTGSLSVAGTADLAGNTATFNANNVCTAVITAGEQSVGFHLTAGTLDATLTPYITNQIGAVNCATAGTCTATAFSSGASIVVTNPSGVKDVGVNLVGGVRQVQVCTTTYSSGSASGVVTATFVQAASSGGGGGGLVTQGTDPWLVAGKGTAGTPSGGVVTVQGAASMTAIKTDGSGVTQPVSGTVAATQSGTWTVQPGNTANTTAWKVDGSAVTQPVSGTVTANIGTSGSLALDATLTGGTQKAIVRGGAKGATAAADVTSTANGVDHQGLDVAVQGTVTVSGTVTTTPPSNASTNVTQFGSTNVSTGTGASGAGIPRVTVANDSNILATQSGTWTVQQGTPPWTTDTIRVGGTTILTGNGVTGAGSQRVTIASDNTPFTVNAAQSGSWTVDISDRAARLLGVVYGSQGQQLKQTAVNFNLQAELAVGGTLIDPRAIRALTSSDTVTVVQPTGTNMHVVCDSGCTPGGSFADGSAFTENTTAINVSGGVYNESLADLDPGEAGAPRVTAKRAMHVNLRDPFGLDLTKGSSQTPTSKDPSVVVQFSPNSPVTFNALVPPKVQIAGTTKVQVADPQGRTASVTNSTRPPTTNDPAQVVAQSPVPAPVCTDFVSISQTASTRLLVGVGGQRIYICELSLVSTTAQSVALIEGTGATCGTAGVALYGHTTVANGMAFAVNGGLAEAAPSPFKMTRVSGDDLCLLQSGAGNLSGSISYVQR